MRRAVAIAIVGALAGLSGCADDSGGPGVAPAARPPSRPMRRTKAAPRRPAARRGSALTTRPSGHGRKLGMKTSMP